MRISVLGSISIVCFAFSSNAWSAPNDAAPAAAPPATTPGASSAPPPAASAPSTPPPASSPSAAPSAAESTKSEPAVDATPSPKQITGPLAEPPPEGTALPPLPSSAPQLYDAPPPPPPPRATHRAEWGAQFRFEAAPMSGDASSNAGMGGIG